MRKLVMKKLVFLLFVTFVSHTCFAKDKVACKYGERPVCAQPPMPECLKGLFCIQMMPAQKNYSNRCEMELAKAYLVSEGACMDNMIEPLGK